MILNCLDCPLDFIVLGVRIHLYVHDIANTIRVLHDVLQHLWSGGHGNSFQRIDLEKLNETNWIYGCEI